MNAIPFLARPGSYERAALAAVFALSFFAYFTSELAPSLQVVPLILFALIVVQKARNKSRQVWKSLTALDAALFIFVVLLFSLPASIASDFSYSTAVWVVTGCVLLLARVYVTFVRLEQLVDALFWAGIISVPMFVIMAFDALSTSIGDLSRFTAFAFQPNTLAFILAAYLCAGCWKLWACSERPSLMVKLLAAVLVVICAIVIFFASSRGSLVAICSGGLFAAVLWVLRTRRFILMGSLAAGSAVLLIVVAGPRLTDATDFVDQVLQLSSSDRGVGSGMTGRLAEWQMTQNRLRHGGWFYGHGMRSTEGLPFFVDNGFLTVLYDLGVVPLLIIAGRYFVLVVSYARQYWQYRSLTYLFFSSFLVVFLVNNVVARYLFGIGNPFSLAAILFFVSPSPAIVDRASRFTTLEPRLGRRAPI